MGRVLGAPDLPEHGRPAAVQSTTPPSTSRSPGTPGRRSAEPGELRLGHGGVVRERPAAGLDQTTTTSSTSTTTSTTVSGRGNGTSSRHPARIGRRFGRGPGHAARLRAGLGYREGGCVRPDFGRPVVLGIALAVLVLLAAACTSCSADAAWPPQSASGPASPPLSKQLFNERRHTMKNPVTDAHPQGGNDRDSGRHPGDQHRAGQRRDDDQRGSVDHPAVGADRESARGRRPDVLQLLGGGDHGRKHQRQSDRRLHPGEHLPAGRPHPGGPRRLHPDQNGVPVTAPGNWNGFSFGSSNLPSSAPGALGSSSLPVYTGQSYSLSELTTAFPNTDTSTTDGYAGLYVLRLRTYDHPQHLDFLRCGRHLGLGHLVVGRLHPAGDDHHDTRNPHPGEPTDLRNVGHVDCGGRRRQRAGYRPVRERRRPLSGVRNRSPTGRLRSRPPPCRSAPTPSPRSTRRPRVRRSPDRPARTPSRT